MREPVVDFLNHGLLPFVGREREMERIVAFWKGSAESTGLRALLLTGEAGSGKSRIIEETIPSVEEGGGVVVHTKLRAESAISLAPLLSLALWSSPSAGPLLREEPDPSLSSVIGAIRRLCRLRRTMLVIEDAHLLEGTALREFNLLVEALADESLALLVVSRPAELTARGAIEGWLVEEISLPLLDRNALSELWNRLFGSTNDPAAIEGLEEATLGNPLAFRSALRGAINAGILTQEQNEWRVVVSASAFREMAVRSAHRLTEGMASHLTDEEREAALLLAPLGEMFAPEGAASLVPDSERMISLLIFKGILVRGSTAATSLRDQNVRGLPLIFAHSLLHRSLLEGSRLDPFSLLKIIASDVPLYSVTPFLFLEEHPPAEAVPVDFAVELVEKAQAITSLIDRTADWQLALRVWGIVEGIAEAAIAADEGHPDILKLKAHVLLYHTYLLGRNDESDEYHERTQRLLDMTEGEEEKGTEWVIALRVRALTYLFRFCSRRDRPRCPEILEQVADLVRRFPSARLNGIYTSFLRVAASCAYIYGFYLDDLRHIEKESRRMMAEGGETPALKHKWLTDFGYYFLSSFTTPEEFEEKRKLLAELYKARIDVPYYYIREIAFHIETGEHRRALELIEKYRPPLRDIGLHRTIYSCIMYECEALTGLGAPIEQILAKGMEVISDPGAPANDLRRNHMGRHILAGIMMRGTTGDIEAVNRTFDFAEAQYPLVVRILLGLPTLESLRNIELVRPASGPGSIDLDDPDVDADELIPAARALLTRTEPDEEAAGGVRTFLEAPILRRYRILSLHTTLSLIRSLASEGIISLSEEWKKSARIGTNNLLAWLAERRLTVQGANLLREHEEWLEEEEKKEWKERFDVAGGEEISSSGEKEKLEITMFGAITFRRPGGEIERIRGARNHLMLGLLVADRMLKKPLTRNAFIAMASGVDDDPERGRRTMNMAVLRLREATDAEIVLTDQETPRLNAERLTIDLIEARAALTRADQLARKRRLTQAVAELRRVFDLSGGDVPFPGLYEELFENLRREFEEDILSVTAALGRRLIAEEDYENAEEILSQGIDIVPESEELQELLRRAQNWGRGMAEGIGEKALLAEEEE